MKAERIILEATHTDTGWELDVRAYPPASPGEPHPKPVLAFRCQAVQADMALYQVITRLREERVDPEAIGF